MMKLEDYKETSSIFDVKDRSITFARNDNYLKTLMDEKEKDIHLLLPYDISKNLVSQLPKNINYTILGHRDSVEYVWTFIHNEIHKDTKPAPVTYGENCNVHPTAIIGVHGNTYAISPDGYRIHLKEIGGVEIGDNVDIEAYSIVHRSCFGNTTIGNGVKICVMCNIGHNTKIGNRTYIAPGVKLGGGTEIGSDSFLWQNVVTHSQVKICDKVMIGNASYVHRDISASGIYVGSPAKFIKPFDERVLKGEVQW